MSPGFFIIMEVFCAQIPDHFPGDNQSGCGGNKSSGTGNIPAHSALPGVRRADAVFPAADGRILQRPDRLFCGIDHLQVLYAPFPAFRAHYPG